MTTVMAFLICAMSMLLSLLLFACILVVIDGEEAPDGKFFYIYDWPDYMNDVWPQDQAELDPKSPYSHEFRGNNGAGKLLIPEIGYFSTWQFSLYKCAMARLRSSERRTMDPSKATSFIIPFDLGAHSFIDHVNGKTRVASPHGWRAVEYLKEIMKSDVYWKNRGHDHFVFFSVTSYQIIGIGAKVFLTQGCMNCSVLTIETSPTFTARKYYSGKSKKWWYAVPYPSSFHWWEGIKELPWISKPTDPPRPYLAVFIGSLDTQTPHSNIVRRRMQKDCLVEPKHCKWIDTAHSCSGMVNNSNSMLIYRQSTFCLAPPGDSLTRKSLFDSIMMGCIPVVNARATITQYLWHIPPEDVDLVSVYIPRQDISDNGLNFLSFLRNISTDKIKKMQQRLQEIAPSIQYSVVPEGYGHDKGNSRGAVFRPPLRDAMDVIIDKLLDRNTVEPFNGWTSKEMIDIQNRRDSVLTWDPAYAGFLASSSVPGSVGSGLGLGIGKHGVAGSTGSVGPKHDHRNNRHNKKGPSVTAAAATTATTAVATM